MTNTAQILLFSSLAVASAQQIIGQNVCMCSPTSYTFKLNLQDACNEASFQVPGVVYTECYSKTDKQPTIIDEIYIQEESDLVSYEQYYGDIVDGNAIEYKSIMSVGPNIAPNNLPKFLSFYYYGEDADGEETENEVYIEFSQECLGSTILGAGLKLGMAEVVAASPADAFYCPALTGEARVAPPPPPVEVAAVPLTEVAFTDDYYYDDVYDDDIYNDDVYDDDLLKAVLPAPATASDPASEPAVTKGAKQQEKKTKARKSKKLAKSETKSEKDDRRRRRLERVRGV